MKPPSNLEKDGRQLWKWIEESFATIEGTEPMVVELCRISDRLAGVRASIKAEGLLIAGRKNPLIDLEIKLSGQFSRIWKVLGLADKDEPKRPVGRPTNAERGL